MGLIPATANHNPELQVYRYCILITCRSSSSSRSSQDGRLSPFLARSWPEAFHGGGIRGNDDGGGGVSGGDGGGGGGDGGGDNGGGGSGGSGDDGGGGGDDVGRCGGECFDGLLIELPLEVGRLPHFPTMRVRTSWSRIAPLLLY